MNAIGEVWETKGFRKSRHNHRHATITSSKHKTNADTTKKKKKHETHTIDTYAATANMKQTQHTTKHNNTKHAPNNV